MGDRARLAAEKEAKGRRPGYDSGGRPIPEPIPFERKRPEVPFWLGEYAKEEWNNIVPDLADQGLLKRIDSSALATYCETWETFRRATEDIHENGLSYMVVTTSAAGGTKQSYVVNPAVNIQKQCAALLRTWAIEFGLTPRAEVGLAMKNNDSKEAEYNPFG